MKTATTKNTDTLRRYRIPCRYHGDLAVSSEARAFVCGAVATTLGAPAEWRPGRPSDNDRFDVWVLAWAPPSPHHVDRWRQATRDLGQVLVAPGAAVQIGEPEDCGSVPAGSKLLKLPDEVGWEEDLRRYVAESGLFEPYYYPESETLRWGPPDSGPLDEPF